MTAKINDWCNNQNVLYVITNSSVQRFCRWTSQGVILLGSNSSLVCWFIHICFFKRLHILLILEEGSENCIGVRVNNGCHLPSVLFRLVYPIHTRQKMPCV